MLLPFVYCQHCSDVLHQQQRRSWIASALPRIQISVDREYSAVVRLLFFEASNILPVLLCGIWVKGSPLSPPTFRVSGQVRKEHCQSLAATYYHSVLPKFYHRALQFQGLSNILLLGKKWMIFQVIQYSWSTDRRTCWSTWCWGVWRNFQHLLNCT